MVRHHLMDYVDASVDVHTVVDYRDEALPIIDDLLQRGKTPVICGGTMYYIEALLWDVLIPSGGIPDPNRHSETKSEYESPAADKLEDEEGVELSESEEKRRKPSKQEIQNLDALELYAKLKVNADF